MIAHRGSWQGFETQISRYVDDKLTVVVLGNLAEAEPEKIAGGVAEIYLIRRTERREFRSGSVTRAYEIKRVPHPEFCWSASV